MEAKVRTINCPSCGAATSPRKDQCDYCGNYLLHLTVFERREKPTSTTPETPSGYFRSLKPLYQIALGLGTIAAVLIYFIFFDDLSEDELVMISPAGSY